MIAFLQCFFCYLNAEKHTVKELGECRVVGFWEFDGEAI